jgi:hypothetical protein
MLSDDLVRFAQEQFDEFEDDFSDESSHETDDALQPLEDIDLKDGLSEKDQVLHLLKQLQECISRIAAAETYIETEREKLKKNSELRDQYPVNSEVLASQSEHEENKEVRLNVYHNLQAATAHAAKLLGVKYDPKNPIEPAELITAIEQGKTNFRYKKLSSFEVIGGLAKSEASGAFSHATQKVHKAAAHGEAPREKHNTVWFAKFCADVNLAGRELVAQEFYRLLMPWQPKTRIAIDDKSNFYILSKSTVGTQAIPMQDMDIATVQDALLHGFIKGYGKISVANLFLNEVDAKAGNMLVNNRTGELVKIDGDWCFARLQGGDHAIGSDITAADIARLPMVQDYQPYNWADLYQEGTLNSNYVTHPKDNILHDSLPSNKKFRREVNEGLLNILMMPKEFLETFVKSYIHNPAEVALLTAELQDRSVQMRNAALNDPAFRKYMKSSAAEKYMEKCINKMLEFNTQGKNSLIKNPEEMRAAFRAEFHGIRTELAPKVVSSSQLIMTQLEAEQKKNPVPAQFLRAAPTAPAPADNPVPPPPPAQAVKPIPPPLPPRPQKKVADNIDKKDDPVFTIKPRR